MNNETTKEIAWTPEELDEFDCLVDTASDANQVTRISGRLALTAFSKLHSKEKCDAMWAHLQERDAKAKKPKGK